MQEEKKTSKFDTYKSTAIYNDHNPNKLHQTDRKDYYY